jgi:hypothetical protein
VWLDEEQRGQSNCISTRLAITSDMRSVTRSKTCFGAVRAITVSRHRVIYRARAFEPCATHTSYSVFEIGEIGSFRQAEAIGCDTEGHMRTDVVSLQGTLAPSVQLCIISIAWHARCSSICFNDDCEYCGTSEGLISSRPIGFKHSVKVSRRLLERKFLSRAARAIYFGGWGNELTRSPGQRARESSTNLIVTPASSQTASSFSSAR